MTDEENLLRYQRGDALAFTCLVESLGNGLYSYVLNQVIDEALAMDLTQDVWTKLMLRAEQICRRIKQDPAGFRLKAYLYTMARNAVKDHYRRQRRLVELPDGDALLDPDATPPNRVLSREELLRCIALRLEGMPLSRQQAFWATRDGRQSYREVADEMRVAMETVKDWVAQALNAIRPCREEFDHG